MIPGMTSGLQTIAKVTLLMLSTFFVFVVHYYEPYLSVLYRSLFLIAGLLTICDLSFTMFSMRQRKTIASMREFLRRGLWVVAIAFVGVHVYMIGVDFVGPFDISFLGTALFLGHTIVLVAIPISLVGFRSAND